MSSGKVFLSVIAGVVAGALLGVLFAPDKGWNTRKRIYNKGEDYAEALSDKFKEFIDNLSSGGFEEFKEEVSDFSEETRTEATEA